MIKLLDILKEERATLGHHDSMEDRKRDYLISIQKKIQQYVKDGSKGDLYLMDTPITSLPPGLEVGGGLYLSYTPITSLPQGLKVGGGLYLDDTPITSLPQGLKVGGDLYLNNTPLSKKYTTEQISQMVPGIEGNIYM